MSQMSATPVASPSRVLAMIRVLASSLVALVAWSFAGQPSTAAANRVLLFLLAAAAVFAATGRHRPWAGLTIVGLLAFTTSNFVPGPPGGWGLLFIGCTAVGSAMWLRQRPGFRWIVASIPFWVYANVTSWAMAAALALSIGGLFVWRVGPTLPGRRIPRGGTPMPHLAGGPLSPISTAVYPGAHSIRSLRTMTFVAAGVCVLLLLLATAASLGTGQQETATLSGALALSSGIMALTFAFSLWFSGRVRLRIDQVGVHGRTMFREQTVRWPDVVSLDLRYLIFPSKSVRVVYYCVRSPNREVAFPSSMRGATDLRTAIEAATGVRWAIPEITANM